MPALFANGKGVSRGLALASAYGELLERVQTGFLVPKGFGLMKDRPFYHLDERFIAVGHLEQSLGATCNPLFDSNEVPWDALEKIASELPCAPFYDVRQGGVLELPLDLLRSSLNANGTCAGNSPEEAIVHGICEVMERFVTRELLTRVPLDLPDVPLNVFRSCASYRLIHELQSRGYEVLIKDCSLGGRFPALGLALKPQDAPLYRYKVGCDPVLEIALQRCFTEIVQGTSSSDTLPLFRVAASDAEATPAERHQRFVRFMFNRLEELPEGLVRRSNTPFDFTPFEERFVSHRHSLLRLVAALFDHGHTLFVRANGFLGFPAYWVYVPDLSPVHMLNEEVLELVLRHRPFVLSCLLHTEGRRPSELRESASLLARARAHNQFHRLFPSSLYPGYRGLDEELILFRLFAQANAVEEARERLRRFLEDRAQHTGTAFWKKLLDHPETVAKGFERVAWPQCGDCHRCPVQATCFFPAWKRTNRALVACMEANPIDQLALEAVFDG